MDINDLGAVLEGILFASGGSVAQSKIAESLELPEETVEAALEKLAGEYGFERRGMRIVRMEDSWQMTSSPEFAAEVRRALELRKPPPLSRAAMEVLAILAYYQPVTRMYIEQIRGVDSSSTVGILAERGLVEDCGYMDVPGRPRLFRTTDAFLRTFGITTLGELPDIGEPDADMLKGQMRIGDENVDGAEQVEIYDAPTDGEAVEPSASETPIADETVTEASDIGYEDGNDAEGDLKRLAELARLSQPKDGDDG